MEQELQAVATILSLVNPAMCATIFIRGEGARPTVQRTKNAAKAVAVITVILLVAAFAGTAILDVFGVSLSAFACAGGGILVWIGAGMLRADTTGRDDGRPPADQAEGTSSSLAPLILFAASPGTITGVITVAASHSEVSLPVTAIIAIAVTSVVLLAVLLVTARFGRGRTAGLGRQITTSYMGLIVIAMGIQFALTGFRDFMAGG